MLILSYHRILEHADPLHPTEPTADVFRWRFTSGEETTQFAYFKDGKRHDELIQGDLATAVAGKFGIDLGMVRRALELVMTEC